MSKLELRLPEFLRIFEKRNQQIIWFLGAGASNSAGIKTGWEMICDFKRKIIRSELGLQDSALADSSNIQAQKYIQQFFDKQGKFPESNAPSEYAVYFEKTYTSTKDRRKYIDDAVSNATPSIGHLIFAEMIEQKIVDIVGTTNFDSLIEDAAYQRPTTDRLIVCGPDNSNLFINSLKEQRRPILVKFHGDYQSENICNTTSELQSQDQQLLQGMLTASQNRGLAVIGYSGRDESVMNMFDNAVSGNSFPSGIFWFYRKQNEIFESVRKLIKTANDQGIEAHLIKVPSFDELMWEIANYIPCLSNILFSLRNKIEMRCKPIKLECDGKKVFPAIRTNAFPIVKFPSTATLIDCEIGNEEETQTTFNNSGSNGVVTRIKSGVIGFGERSALENAFSDYHVKNVSIHKLERDRFKFETGELRLMRSALFSAIAKSSGLKLERYSRSYYLNFVPKIHSSNSFNGLKNLSSISGTVPKTSVGWREVCKLRLEFKNDRFWLLLCPQIKLDFTKDSHNSASDGEYEFEKEEAKNFIRERYAGRYNRQANRLLESWKKRIFEDFESIIVSLGSVNEGFEANFELCSTSGFSVRSK